MRIPLVIITTYAVRDRAFGRAALYLSFVFGFCARKAQKPNTDLKGSTMLPQAKRPV
jgi:hypothetical protein